MGDTSEVSQARGEQAVGYIVNEIAGILKQAVTPEVAGEE